MRAEDHVDIARVVESGHRPGNDFDQRVQIGGVLVKPFDHVNAGIPAVGMETARPFIQAAAGGGLGVLRIERQQHQIVGSVLLHLVDRLFGEGVPVTHRDGDARVEVVAEFGLERRRLPPGVLEDRAAAADFRVVMRHVFGTGCGDQPRQGLAGDACKWEIDDVGIAEQVVQERLDIFQAIGPTELKENHPEFHNL